MTTKAELERSLKATKTMCYLLARWMFGKDAWVSSASPGSVEICTKLGKLELIVAVNANDPNCFEIWFRDRSELQALSKQICTKLFARKMKQIAKDCEINPYESATVIRMKYTQEHLAPEIIRKSIEMFEWCQSAAKGLIRAIEEGNMDDLLEKLATAEKI